MDTRSCRSSGKTSQKEHSDPVPSKSGYADQAKAELDNATVEGHTRRGKGKPNWLSSVCVRARAHVVRNGSRHGRGGGGQGREEVEDK